MPYIKDYRFWDEGLSASSGLRIAERITPKKWPWDIQASVQRQTVFGWRTIKTYASVEACRVWIKKQKELNSIVYWNA